MKIIKIGKYVKVEIDIPIENESIEKIINGLIAELEGTIENLLEKPYLVGVLATLKIKQVKEISDLFQLF